MFFAGEYFYVLLLFIYVIYVLFCFDLNAFLFFQLVALDESFVAVDLQFSGAIYVKEYVKES